MLMPSGRSLTTVLNREPGCAGTVGSNVPSPCKVPTPSKRVPGRGLPIGEYSWCLWSHATAFYGKATGRAPQGPMRGYRNSDIGLTATPTRTDMQ